MSQHQGRFIKVSPGAFIPPHKEGSSQLAVVRPFKKATAQEYKNILAITNYFSKWTEGIVVRDFPTMTAAKFIRIHIIYRFGLPKTTTTDNGQPFKSAELCNLSI